MVDLFRCAMSPDAGRAVAALYTPDKNGRIYCGQGAKTDQFEIEFAKTTGLIEIPLGVNSCSAALDIALHLLGVGPGDEIISTPQTCTATSGAIVNRGATIVWADIDPELGLISPLSVASLVTSKTKAVVAVDWAGRACNYSALREATDYLPIIEDAAHRLYAPDIHGDYVAWSFGPIKVLTTGGYGGALLPPAAQHKRAELLRWHGLDRTTGSADFRCAQDISEAGYRYHMTDDQAVIGLANLKLAQENVAQARINAEWYCRQLADVPGITVLPYDPGCDYWLYGLLVHNDRDGFMQRMTEAGIATSRVHARNDHHSAFIAAAKTSGSLDGVDYFDAHQVNIPVGAWVTMAERSQIVEAVKASVRITVSSR